MPEKKIKLLEKNMRAARFRIELLGDKKLLKRSVAASLVIGLVVTMIIMIFSKIS